MTKSVLWSSCQRLACASQQTPTVVLCLTEEGLVNGHLCTDDTYGGFPFTTLEGTLTKVWRDDNGCGTGSYRYLVAYDENDLVDPATPLDSAKISGVFCKGCLTTWVENEVGDEVTLQVNEDGSLIFTSQHGCITEVPAPPSPLTFSDTESIDFTVAGDVVTADVNISADADNIISIHSDGLYASAPSTLTFDDTNSVNLTDTADTITADVNISATSDNQVSIVGDGLLVPKAAGLTVSDTNSVDLTLSSGALSADSKISATSGNQVSIAGDGLLVPKAAGLTVSDTNSVDLTLSSGALSADSKISATSGNQVSIAGDGLLVPKAAGLTVSDTNSVDLTLSSGALSADVKISATGGNTITTNADGIYSAGGTGFINSVTDTNSIDLTVSGTALSADSKISATSGNQVSIAGDGLLVPKAAGLTVSDTNSVDLTLSSGALSADSKISATSGNQVSIAGDGLLVPKAAGLTVSDTSSVDLTLSSGALSADVKISATGGNTISINADGIYSAGGGGGGMSIGGTVTSGTAGSVLFVGSGPVLAQDNASLFFDDTNNRLGLLTTTPNSSLETAKSFGANIVTKTANYTADESDYTILCDATSASFTITLPAVSGITRRIYNIKKIDSSANTVTIDGNASETIDGATTKVISAQYDSFTIQTNGSAWYVL